MTLVHASLFLTGDETITADDTATAGGHCTIRYGGLALHFDVDQLPQRIAELQAVVLALRDVVDDIIADDKANRPEPDWETVLGADLTAGRHIQRCGHEQPDEWRTITARGPHSWLPGVTWLQFDDGGVATVADDEAVRALVVVADVPVGETVEVA